MNNNFLPDSVRYVKNGRGGQWWRASKDRNQIHLGWKTIPKQLLLKPDFQKLRQAITNQYGKKRGATQDFNAVHDLLDTPSQHVWITFQDGYMWWCTARDGATVNPSGESVNEGNFWLSCNRPWSNRSLNGRLLAIPELPGSVTTTAGFQSTVCTPRAWRTVLRIIRDEKDPDATRVANARSEYQDAVLAMVKRLSWKDFEQLIDHILTRTGWARISTLGKTREGIDIEAENLAAGEIAFVQVKSSANQKVLDDYVSRFRDRRELYARMIFAVHSPSGSLDPPDDMPVQVWTGQHISGLVVRLGLGEWVETRLG